MKTLVLLSVLLTSLAVASPRTGTVIVDTDKILNDSSLTPTQKSATLTQQGEWLLTKDSIFLPYDIFKKALELDSSNLKAKIYVAGIAPYMNYKGLLGRIEKLATASSEGKKNYQEIKESYKDDPMLYSFLMTPGPAFDSEKEIQPILEKALNDFLKFREVLRDLHGKKLPLFNVSSSIHGNDGGSGDLPEDPKEKQLTHCRFKIEGGKYTLSTCPILDRSIIHADEADLDFLELQSNFFLVGLVLATSYDLTGVVEHLVESRSNGKKTDEVNKKAKALALRNLLNHEEFGKLLSPNKIKLLSQLGGDALVSLRTYARYEKAFCPQTNTTNESTHISRATNVFSTMCLLKGINNNNKDMGIVDNLNGLNQVIQSGSGIFQLFSRATPHKTVFNFTQAHERPVEDVKTLGLKIGKCGEFLINNDQAVGGILPDGDVNILSTGFARCLPYTSL